MIRVANAPCSWGVLEFEAPAAHAPAAQVLDEMAAAGYAGTELGDWGFLPTDPAALAADVQRRALSLVGAFVPIALARKDALDEGLERAVRTARLLAAVNAEQGTTPGKGAVPLFRRDRVVRRQHLGAPPHRARRADPRRGRPERRGVGRLRGACRPRGGSGPRRDRRTDRLPPSLRRLRRDAAGDRGADVEDGSGRARPLPRYRAPRCTRAAIRSMSSRSTAIASGTCTSRTASRTSRDRRARKGGTTIRPCVEASSASSARAWCRSRVCSTALRVEYYAGWIVVEQDVLPGLGTPAASARRNREYLRRLGL